MDETTTGREPVQYVEIYQPVCSLDYGVSPCAAQIGITGSGECYNTRRTCQDAANYDQTDRIAWIFTRPSDRAMPPVLQDDVIRPHVIPSLRSVSTVGTRINVGGTSDNVSAFGRRSVVKITLMDHVYDDRYADKYADNRPYDPVEQGTFWGRLLARAPYHSAWDVVVYDGYRGQAIADMVSKRYILEDIDGPDSNGNVTITAKDPLKFVDDKRAEAPRAIEAYLNASIDDVTTAIDIVGQEDDISAEMGSTGSTRYIRINDEIIEYTGYTAATVITLTGVTRGVLGTDAASHEADDAINRCIRYVDVGVWDIMYDLLVSYSSIPPTYIDLAEWIAEGEAYIPQYTLTATIAEPRSVNTLMGELQQQCLSYLIWDERTSKILYRVIRPTVPIATLDEHSNIIRNSTTVREEDKERVSRVAVYYRRSNPTLADDEISNYAYLRLQIDGDAESPDQYGDIRTKSIYSRWLTTDTQAVSLTARLLSRYRDVPRYITIKVDAKDRDIWTGDIVSLTTTSLQQPDGSPIQSDWQVITAEEITPGEIVKFDLQSFAYYGRTGHYMADGSPDYQDATPEELAVGGWYAGDDGTIDGDQGYTYG